MEQRVKLRAHLGRRLGQALGLIPILLVSAWIEPVSALSADEAHFFLSRTGFEPSPWEIETILPLDREAAVDKIVSTIRTGVATAPAWVGEPWPISPDPKKFSPQDFAVVRRAFEESLQRHQRDLQAFWVDQMLSSPSPLTERLVLFWHNHFTSAMEKVRPPQYLWIQDHLIREYAGGNFAAFLHAMARDPAMTSYLDNQANNKGKPNENFARELLELFTLGEGHYQEADIKEAARAFTGWHDDYQTGSFYIDRRQHDDGQKTFLGRTGPLTGDDIVDIILDQPQTSVFITERLWREFVSPDPDPKEVSRMAQIFRTSGYHIKPLLQALFLSDAFWSPLSRQTLVKSPAQLAVGFVRSNNIRGADTGRLVSEFRNLGQDLFNPLSVKGWPAGIDWIDSSSLISRNKMLKELLQSWETDNAPRIDWDQDAKLKSLIGETRYEMY